VIQKAPDLTYADITPKSVYLDRADSSAPWASSRDGCRRKSFFDLALPPETALAAAQSPAWLKAPSAPAKNKIRERRFLITTFYEFGSDKSTPLKMPRISRLPLDGIGRSDCENPPARVHHGEILNWPR